MTERVSNWSQVMLSHWLSEAVCPDCHEANMKGKKPLIELNEQGAAYCQACGYEWHPPRYVAKAVNE